MRGTAFSLAALLQLRAAIAMPAELIAGGAIAGRDLQDLQIRDKVQPKRDCGSWKMYCGGVPNAKGGRGQSAEGACNNACYYINFLAPTKGTYQAVYDPDVSDTKNREQSGCQPKAGNDANSICNDMPFSQRFHDDFEREPDVTKQKFNCDEFPMASMSQDDFKKGTIRNSLRCIPALENSSGGQQLTSFIHNNNPDTHTGRKAACKGDLQKGDYFTIDFDYTGADKSKLQYCQFPNQPKPDQNAEQHQFYMTDFKGQHGTMDFPYKPDRDNHYAIANNGKDILQCKIEVLRTMGDNYAATVYDGNGAKQGSGSKQLGDDEAFLKINGKGGLENTYVMRTGQFGTGKGSKVFFYYGNDMEDVTALKTTPKSDLWTNFQWFSDYVGNDNKYHQVDGTNDVAPGGYCKVPDIDNSNEDGPRQTITCYFPCQAP